MLQIIPEMWQSLFAHTMRIVRIVGQMDMRPLEHPFRTTDESTLIIVTQHSSHHHAGRRSVGYVGHVMRKYCCDVRTSLRVADLINVRRALFVVRWPACALHMRARTIDVRARNHMHLIADTHAHARSL